MVEKLRDEILQCETVRHDLLKWKLAIVGGLGAAGLGLAGSEQLHNADLILCVIPPTAVYVDLLSRHLALKMLVLGMFQSKWDGSPETTVFHAYEGFAENARHMDGQPEPHGTGWWGRLLDWLVIHFMGRKRSRERSAFDLEDWALSLSSVVLSVALIVYGIIVSSWFSIAFIVSAVASLMALAIGNEQYMVRFEAIQRLPLTNEEGQALRPAYPVTLHSTAIAMQKQSRVGGRL